MSQLYTVITTRGSKMTFNEYQEQAVATAIYTHDFYPFASLMIEASEFSDLVAKNMLRGDMKDIKREDLIAEAGDVLWCLAAALDDYDIPLAQVAEYNIEKLRDRAARGVLTGDGGDR